MLNMYQMVQGLSLRTHTICNMLVQQAPETTAPKGSVGESHLCTIIGADACIMAFSPAHGHMAHRKLSAVASDA